MDTGGGQGLDDGAGRDASSSSCSALGAGLAAPFTGVLPPPAPVVADENVENEEKAKELFMKGVELEQKGQLHDAVCKYKKAVQLVPDIEFRAFRQQEQLQNCEYEKMGAWEGEETPAEDDSGCVLLDTLSVDENLEMKFSRRSSQDRTLCSPERPCAGTHISSLPMEILINIMRWVVSSHLDLRSLECCSGVCRGFYLAARSSDIWRSVCRETWGIKPMPESAMTRMKDVDWRRLYLRRPRVRFNGCYVARITYTREGERSFQDSEHYRTWYMVHYYRIMRFYPGGRVVMVTSVEDPVQVVGLLNDSRSPGFPGCMVGRYQTVNDRVRCVVQQHKDSNNNGAASKAARSSRKGRKGTIDTSFEVPDQVFNFEMLLKGKNHSRLGWLKYTIISRYRSNDRVDETNIDTQHGNSYPVLQWLGMPGSVIYENSVAKL